MRILIIEDDSNEVALFKAIFAKYNAITYVTNNPYEGLHIAMNDEIDILITDLAMPVLDGFTIIEEIRKVNKTLPIIAVSCYVNKDAKDRCFSLGGSYFIEKPFEIEDIYKVVNNIRDEFGFE